MTDKLVSDISGKTCLIFGAGSDIAAACARKLAAQGYRLVLVNRSTLEFGRSGPFSEAVAGEYYGVDFASPLEALPTVRQAIVDSKPTLALIAQGVMHPGAYAAARIVEMYQCNLVSVALILDELTKSQQAPQEVIVIGSIAGDRGKEKNPVYDSSKAGLATLCQGYRQRLAHRGCRLLLVKPGNVATRMTKDKAHNWTWATPERIAEDVAKALGRGGGTIYTPWPWRLVMWIIAAIPEKIFVKFGLGNAN